jgi:hypothetical protein
MLLWVFGFSIVSLAFLLLALRAWRGETVTGAAPAERGPWRGRLILTGISLLSLAAVWLAADSLGWQRDRALWVGLGALLGLSTVIRPWCFWEDHKARWLRGLIGDEATAFIYLLLSAVMVWVGLFTDWHFGRQ